MKCGYAGIRLPLQFCVDKCTTDTPKFLLFQGEIALELSATATTMIGSIEMSAPWYLAIVPWLHVLTGKLLVGLEVKVRLSLRDVQCEREWMSVKQTMTSDVAVPSWDLSHKVGTFCNGLCRI